MFEADGQETIVFYPSALKNRSLEFRLRDYSKFRGKEAMSQPSEFINLRCYLLPSYAGLFKLIWGVNHKIRPV